MVSLSEVHVEPMLDLTGGFCASWPSLNPEREMKGISIRRRGDFDSTTRRFRFDDEEILISKNESVSSKNYLLHDVVGLTKPRRD